MKNLENLNKISYLIYQLIIFSTMIILFFMPHRNIILDNEPVADNLNKWYYFDNNNEKHYIQSFPFKISLEKIKINNEKITLYRDYSKSFIDNFYMVDDFKDFNYNDTKNIKYISIYSNKKILDIKIDKDIFLDNIDLLEEEEYFFGKIFKNKNLSRVFIATYLPNELENKTISVDFYLAKDFKRFEVKNIFEGFKSAVLFAMIRENIYDIVFAIFLFIVSIVFFTVYFIFKNKLYEEKENKNSYYLLCYYAIFLFSASLLIIFNSSISQFIVNSYIYKMYFEYIGLNLMTVSLILLINFIDGYGYKRYNNIMIFMLFIFNIIVLILNVFLSVSFYIIFILSTIIIEIVIAHLILLLLFDILIHKNKNSINYFILGIIVSIPTIFKLLFDIDINALIPNIVLNIISFVCFIVFSEKPVIYMYNSFKEFKINVTYKELATTDVMCEIKNRNAYMFDLKSGKFDGCIVADLNNLKYINDNIGHLEGDNAIKKTANILKNILINSFEGELYRIGGDEFVILTKNVNYEQLEEFQKECIACFKQEQKNLDYGFAVSIGIANFDSKIDNSFEDTIKRADIQMYDMKMKMKNKN